MTYRLASQTSGFNGERRILDSPSILGTEPREDRMFTLKGKVSSLEVSDGSVDPLQGLQQRVYGEGMNQVIDSFGVSSLGEKRVPVQHFGCLIGERVVVGTFPAVGFKNGDAVKAVVTNLDGEGVFAHALMTTANGRLWLPHSVSKGTHASLIGAAKVALVAAFAVWLCVLLAMLATAPRGGVFVPALLAALALLALGAAALFLVNRASPEGAYTDKILSKLGFRNPKMVNLKPFSERAQRLRVREQDGSPHVYDLWAALAKYGAVKKRVAVVKDEAKDDAE